MHLSMHVSKRLSFIHTCIRWECNCEKVVIGVDLMVPLSSNILANVKLSLLSMFDKAQLLLKASPSDIGLLKKLGLTVSMSCQVVEALLLDHQYNG